MRMMRKKRVVRAVAVALAAALVLVFYCFGVAAFDVMKGDFDGNGKVTAADARMILRVAARVETIRDADVFFRCDITGDGRVGADDARRALRMAAKLEQVILVSSDQIASIPVSVSQTTPGVSSVPAVDTTDAPAQTTAPPATETTPSPTSLVPSVPVFSPDAPAYPAIPEYTAAPNTFVFITFGYGHGVGLSQYGAIGMARNGYDYLSILAHYFQGVTFTKETIPAPVSVLHTGEKVDTFELLCRVVQQEIGGITKSADMEALKAQTVAAYTLLKSHNFTLPNRYTMAYSASMQEVKSDVVAAVTEVAGTFMTYDGQLISTPFFAYSAGRTTDAAAVWGSAYPYLRPVPSYYDIDVRTYSGYADLINVKSISADLMRKYIKSYDGGIELSDDPAQWLQVLAHDGAVSPSIGYVSSMRVGNKILQNCAGQILRMNILDLTIRSHCFALVYYDNNLVPHDCGVVMA